MTPTSQQRPVEEAVILVVDDQRINLEILNAHLSPLYRVFMTQSGAEALMFCNQSAPDLIILDVVMPEMDGLETCRRIKADDKLKDIPILFSTSLSSPDEQTQCWDVGGSDFLSKPVHPMTLKKRVHAHLKLKFQTDQLKSIAYLDGLTGIFNRRYLELWGNKLIENAKRVKQSICLVMLDVDHFKLYNDTFGHIQGDDCLRDIAQTLQTKVQRPMDIVSRYGGEEFCCVLPDTDLKGAQHLASIVCRSIEQLALPNPGSQHKVVTVSVGIAKLKNINSNLTDLISRADKCLYSAKKKGRNQWVSEPE